MTDQEIIQKLQKIEGTSDVAKIHSSFSFVRQIGNDSQDVVLSILDFGEQVPEEQRYMCVAEADNGKRTCGNQNSLISLAISDIHWEKLD